MPFTSYVSPSQEKPTPQEPLYKEIPDNIDTLVAEVKRGRPKGSRNKPKNPLATNEVRETRSNRNPLIDQQPINLGISPFALARENNKKQKMMNQYFKKKPQAKNDETD